MSPIVAWIFALLTSLRAVSPMPGHAETKEEYSSRLQSIAVDVAAVAYDPLEPPLWDGPHGRKRTAAQIVALAYLESGFARDVDVGPCYPRRDPKTGLVRCDGLASACIMQVRVGAGTTREGWSKADLFADRQKCIRAGLAIARRSFGACRKRGPDALLNAYASGGCTAGQAKGLERLELGRRLFASPGRPADADASFLIAPPAAGGAHARAR